jgi:high-affinity iron transporter
MTTSAPDTEVHPLVRAGAYVAPVATIQLVPPLSRYTAYVDRLARRLTSQVGALTAATARNDLPAAESAWVTAHATWLEIGQDDDAYGAFGELGERIDGLADGLPHTTASPSFTGFHKVELDLWRRHDTAAATSDSRRLQELVGALTPTRVARDLPVKTLAIDLWVLRAHEILEDALRDSLSEDDDYGSNTDLASLSADATATQEMLSVLAPLIRPRASSIVPRATVELATLRHAIAAAGGARAHVNLRLLAPRRRQALDEATDAAVTTLAPVSEIMQIATPGS